MVHDRDKLRQRGFTTQKRKEGEKLCSKEVILEICHDRDKFDKGKRRKLNTGLGRERGEEEKEKEKEEEEEKAGRCKNWKPRTSHKDTWKNRYEWEDNEWGVGRETAQYGAYLV